MTNKKAIEILKNMLEYEESTEDMVIHENWGDEQLREVEESIEAINMGIVALGGSR